jgi:hypothetical protein
MVGEVGVFGSVVVQVTSALHSSPLTQNMNRVRGLKQFR